MCDQYFGHNSLPGGGVYVLENAFGVEPRLRDVTAGAAVQNGRLLGQILGKGSFLSPELSFDGKTVVFAHSERTAKGQGTWRPENSYHLFRIGLDGSNLRQLGDGCWNEFDPCFLPNSKIAFISERRGGYGRCHGRPVPTYTLFRMNQDGSDIECLSYHETNEWHPVVGHDGKIVYTRWDYVDREPNLAHSAWTTTPDGRDPRAIYGNYQKIMHGPRPQMSMSIRPIPNSGKYIATATPHHGFAFGSLFLFDPLEADDGMLGSGRRITPDKPFPESEESPFKAPWTQAYGTPWPLSEDYYLCAYDDAARGEDYGLYLLDSFGNKELIYRDPAISSISPIPVQARPVPPVMTEIAEHKPATSPEPPITDTQKMTCAPASSLGDPGGEGKFLVGNVYDSRYPFPKDTKITALRIIQVLMKSTPYMGHPQIGYAGSNVNTLARRVLGTVPVEADGSAHFKAPIHRLLYFQALDEKGRAVQSMRSGTYLQRGDTVSCQGCHEPAANAPTITRRMAIAYKRPPSVITAEVDGSQPFSYPRLVQPVLDRACVKCHEENRTKHAPDLRGIAGLPTEAPIDDSKTGRQFWYPSYRSLGPYVYRVPLHQAETIPGQFGALGSKLTALLEKGHHDVKLSTDDWRRLNLWMDCNADFYGAYDDPEGQAQGKTVAVGVE